MKKLQKLIEYLFYLFVFLLPWQTRWIWYEGELNKGFWEYGTFSLYGIDILFVIILALAGIYFICKKKIKNQKPNSKFCITFYVLPIVFLVIAFLSVLWAQNKGLALYASVKLLEGILLFWLVSKMKLNFTKLGIAFVSSAVIQAGLGIWQFLTQSTFANKWLGMALQIPGRGDTSVIESSVGRWLRAHGSLPHPNMLASWLVVGLFILLGLAYRFTIQKKSFWKALHPNLWLNIFIYWSCVIIVTGLFFTFSREAWLALIIGLVFFWIIVLIKKQAAIFYKLLATGLATIIVLSFIFWPLLSTRLSGQDRLEVKSRQERTTYLNQSFQLIKKHWLTGVGVGNYTLAVHNQIDPNLKSWDYQPVHNVYLLILAELGIIGLGIFLWLIFYIIKRLFSFQIRQDWPWTLIYPVAILAILIIAFFDHYFWTLHFGIMLFWLILGLSTYTNSEQTVDNPS